MWARIKRLLRSIFGGFIAAREDPKKILEQNIRDMRDKIPEINEGLVKARTGIIRLENEAKSYEAEIRSLTSKIKACITTGDDELGGNLAMQLKRVREAHERNKEQLEATRGGYDHMKALKEKFSREMKAKTDEAMRAIQEAEAAKWKKKLADVFDSFEVAGVDATHQEMVEKLKTQAAEAEARLAVAKDSVDIKSFEMEKRAAQLEGMELLRQFKLDMGLAEPQKPLAEASEVKTIGPKEKEKETE